MNSTDRASSHWPYSACSVNIVRASERDMSRGMSTTRHSNLDARGTVRRFGEIAYPLVRCEFSFIIPPIKPKTQVPS